MKEYDSEAFDGDSINSAPLGQRLRTAREGTGLGIEEVASLLNLEESLVRALEDEDYEVLPSPIFIRGYLRAYGKLLRLDGNELIEVYSMQSGGMDPDLATSSSSAGSGLSGFPIVAVAGGVVVLLVVASLGWWLMSDGDVAQPVSQEEPLSSSVVAQAPADANAIALPQQPKITQVMTAKTPPAIVPKIVPEATEKSPADTEKGAHSTSSVLASIAAAKPKKPLDEPKIERAGTGGVADQSHRSVQSAVETMLEERQWAQNDGSTNKASVVSAAVSEPADAKVAQGVLSSIQSAVADAPASVSSSKAVESEVVATNKKVMAALNASVTESGKTKTTKALVVSQDLSKLNVGPVAPNGSDVLLLSSSGDSWAEVFDANGYRLLYDMLKVGSAKRLQGTAPFKVFLGNSPQVLVNLNSTEMQQKRFNRKNNTARFVVDGKGVRRR